MVLLVEGVGLVGQRCRRQVQACLRQVLDTCTLPLPPGSPHPLAAALQAMVTVVASTVAACSLWLRQATLGSCLGLGLVVVVAAATWVRSAPTAAWVLWGLACVWVPHPLPLAGPLGTDLGLQPLQRPACTTQLPRALALLHLVG